MRLLSGRRFGARLIAATAILAAASAASAQSLTSGDIELTPEEIAEREGRKACKVAICKAFHTEAPGEVSCNVIKSWRQSQLDKLANKAAVSWPWGKVKCEAPLALDAAALRQAITAPDYELQLADHTVRCVVEREAEDATIQFSFKPHVTFKAGKAVKARLNWGKIEAPTLVKGAMWTATATDNTFNVLQSTIVDDINDFVTKKCDEVKTDWSGTAPAPAQ